MDTCLLSQAPRVAFGEAGFHRSGGWRFGIAVVAATLFACVIGNGALAVERRSVSTASTPTATATAPAPSAAVRGDADRARAARDGIEPDRVADVVRHHVTPITGRLGVLAATDASYRASFDATGFHVSPAGSTAGLGVMLRSVERGGAALALQPGAWHGGSNRAERNMASGIREAVTARNGEVEWDVVLARPLAGRGDLVVSAALSGAAAVSVHGKQLHVRLQDGREVRMGELVVRDASGAVVHRAMPLVRRGHLALVVPDRVLASARYPLTLDPTVSAEHPVTPAASQPFNSDIAFDGTNYLVVWSDYRFSNAIDLYGARVRPDGVVLDPNAIPISTAPSDQSRGTVVWDGSEYLVVWQDFRAQNGYSDIYASRVTKAGVVLDTAGVPFSLAPRVQTNPEATFDGTNVFVVWEDARSNTNYDVYGLRWSPTFGVLDANGIPISTAAGDQLDPVVTYTGTNELVAWDQVDAGNDSNVYGARVRTNGAVLDTTAFPISAGMGNQALPAVAYNGTVALIAWQDSRSGANDIYGTRFSTADGIMDPGGFPISSSGGNPTAPAVAANGSFLVAWNDNRNGNSDIYGARVTTDGNVSDPVGFGISVQAGGDFTPAASKGDGSNWAVTYDHGTTTNLREIKPK